MSERDYGTKTYVSNRDLLCKESTLYCVHDKYEMECLYKYRDLVKKIKELQAEIQKLSTQPKSEASITYIEAQIRRYNIQLSGMESEYPLRYVIQRLREKEQASSVEYKQSQQKNQTTRPKKKKSIVKALNKLYDEGVFTALTYIITFLWFGYLVNVVATADTHIIGKIFFIVWSLVLAFIFVIHKFGGNNDD